MIRVVALSSIICSLGAVEASKAAAPLTSATLPPVSRKAFARPWNE